MMLSQQEPMYAAFFVHGADCVRSTTPDHKNGLIQAATLCDYGFFEFVHQMIAFAADLQTMVNIVMLTDTSTDFPGVFEYEVCEGFGAWYVMETIKNHSVDNQFSEPTVEQCRDYLKKEVFRFFTQNHAERDHSKLKQALGIEGEV